MQLGAHGHDWCTSEIVWTHWVYVWEFSIKITELLRILLKYENRRSLESGLQIERGSNWLSVTNVVSEIS